MVGMSNAIEQPVSWQAAHAALSRLAKQQAAADAAEGRGLLYAFRAATHLHLGFGTFYEYVERLFGYKPRTTQEKLRVAAALEGLPALRAALEGGQLNWSAVRELTRVAIGKTEQEWLQLAAGKSLRQIEQLVAGRQLGNSPDSPSDPSAVRHTLCFDVNAETYAVVREAIAELRRRSATGFDDDTALLEMARHVLMGPRDEGRSSYQIVLSVCPSCSTARQSANGRMVSHSARTPPRGGASRRAPLSSAGLPERDVRGSASHPAALGGRPARGGQSDYAMFGAPPCSAPRASSNRGQRVGSACDACGRERLWSASGAPARFGSKSGSRPARAGLSRGRGAKGHGGVAPTERSGRSVSAGAAACGVGKLAPS